MTVAYWIVKKSELDAKVGDTGFDADGIHECCRQHGNYARVKKRPAPTLDVGPVVDVLLKCDDSEDLTTHYPTATKHTLEQFRLIKQDVTNQWFDPDVEM